MITKARPTADNILKIVTQATDLPESEEDRFVDLALDIWHDAANDPALANIDAEEFDADVRTGWVQLAEEIATNFHDPNYWHDS